MEKVDRPNVVALLVAENPRATLERVHLYADAFVEYQTAQANIAEHGSVTFHPRTASPIENPYIRTRERAVLAMERCRLRTEGLWLRAWPRGTDGGE